jgi:sterol desaturase/sphingolipid hydroxylase (fatty acid hydroxylase superfamily)
MTTVAEATRTTERAPLAPAVDDRASSFLAPASGRAWRWYPPALVALALTAWLAWRGVVLLDQGGELTTALGAARHQLVGPVVLGLLVVVFGAERLWPAQRRPLLARGHVQDALYLLLYAVAVVPVIVVIGVGFSHLLQRRVPDIVLPPMAFLPHWVALVPALVAMDAANWLAHWCNHRLTALWRLHALHHSQEEMSILTSFRTHPLVHTSFLITVIPAVALSANAVVPSTAIIIYLCLATFPHANLRWSFGPVGRVLVSPSYHRIHHAARGRNDLNLGTVLTVWDVLSHRAVFPSSTAAVIDTGLAGRPLPVEHLGHRRRPLSVLAAQLLEPFVDRWPEKEGTT